MTAASSWVGIVSLILFLALMSGFWAGLIGLWKARRGAAWWLMAVGTAFNTIGPILYTVGTVLMFNSFTRSMSSGSTPSVTPSAMFGILMVVAGFLIPIGLILFSIGFAMHGMKAARVAGRADELETLTAAMSEEITRLREGGPSA